RSSSIIINWREWNNGVNSFAAGVPPSVLRTQNHQRTVAMKRRRNKANVFIHYVWATHERLPLITKDVERNVYRYIEKVCQDDRCEVMAIGGTPDHVHLLVAMSNLVSMSALMQHVKGGSSRFISTSLKPDAWFAWQAHYAAFCVAI